MNTFEQWFQQQKDKGLQDIKISLYEENASIREVKEEIVRMHQSAQAGITEPLPTANDYNAELAQLDAALN